MAQKSSKKRKRKSGHGGGGGGGGGVLMSLRTGFKNAAHRAAGAPSKKKPSKTWQVVNWVITVVLLGVAAYLFARRFGYID
jgi:hypothetical protein